MAAFGNQQSNILEVLKWMADPVIAGIWNRHLVFTLTRYFIAKKQLQIGMLKERAHLVYLTNSMNMNMPLTAQRRILGLAGHWVSCDDSVLTPLWWRLYSNSKLQCHLMYIWSSPDHKWKQMRPLKLRGSTWS